jgi:CSLREA domain-containing protein
MRSLVLSLFLFFSFALIVADADAAVFTVNSQADVPDETPGNGVCNPVLAIPGVCTLRAAIMEANALAGADTVFLTAGQTYTLTRAGQDDSAVNGDLDITDNVSILFFASGERPVVDANGLERAFDIRDGNATMLGFDITGGDATVPGDASGGGIAIDFDAGIVQLSLLRFYGNRSCFGGGLYNDGDSTTVSASEFFDNERDGTGCTPLPGGAAIHNRGQLIVEASSLVENAGTAIFSGPGGPGIGQLSVINSTVSSNLGGGINTDNDDNGVDQVTTLRNTTIAGNTGTGLRIGGISTSLSMRNTMIARNDVDGAIGDCALSVAASATYNTDRYNLDSDGTCDLQDGSSNVPDTNPLLTPLKYRGGLSQVHWPRPDSPIIDAGHPVIGAIGCEEEDQHFVERPQDFNVAADNNCDVGAVELAQDVIFFDSHEVL